MTPRTFRSLASSVAACCLAALALTACSSSGGSSGGGGTTTDAGLQEATTLTQGYSKPAANVAVTVPVGKPIPKGKTVAVMTCGQPACDNDVPFMTDAAKHLGWTTRQYIAGPTPDKNKAAWDQVVQDKPDAVISIGFPQSLWAQDSKKLEAEGIPVVECCAADQPGNGVVFVEIGSDAAVMGGKMQADWVISDSKGKANAVFLNIPAYANLPFEAKGFKSEFERLCAGCSYSQLDLNIGDVGTPAEKQAIVGYLQSHPDVDYVVAGDDDSFQGIPAALKAAGLSKIRAIGLAPSTANLNYIAQGQVEMATVSFPQAELGWKCMDILARHFTGQSLDADKPLLPRMIITKDTITDPNTIEPATPTYQSDFLKLWGLSSS